MSKSFDASAQGFPHSGAEILAPTQPDQPPNLEEKTWLVTGSAGFVGSHLVDRLLAESEAQVQAGQPGFGVIGVDNFDPFYHPDIKKRILQSHLAHPRFQLVQADIQDPQSLAALSGSISAPLAGIIHLAAVAGVRPSLVDPARYLRINVLGTQHLLDFARQQGIQRFVFASSSSVYGTNPRLPWREQDLDLRPISPYAASKLSAEALGRVYSHHYGIRFTALRLFTVYGPRQRPDLAIHKFARRMLAGEPISVFGDGSTCRDYTYVTDTVAGIRAAMDWGDPNPEELFSVFNLGHGQRVSLMEMIRTLEQALEIPAHLDWQPEQPGDVAQTWADISRARQYLGYHPTLSFEQGIRRFVDWLKTG